MHHAPILILSSVLYCLTPATAQVLEDRAADARIDKAVKVFARQSTREQKRVLAEVRLAIDAVKDEYLDSIRAAASAGRKLATKRKLKSRQKKSGKNQAAAWSELPFPLAVEYAFGFQQTRDVDPPTGGRLSKSRREAQRRQAELQSMLHGHPPGLDQALAAILKQLDHDRSADALAQLFETWRNGPESFYHALDRTAGTGESLFFYDAMLDDFLRRCVPKKSVDYKVLRRSHDDAHGALHRSFLAYRQYRAFREAVALSLLLPSGVKFPARLRRYETAGDGLYSVRQQVALLLQGSKQDIIAAAQAIQSSAKPLPEPLWSSSYQPVAALSELVDALPLPATSDQLLAQQDSRRTKISLRIAATARGALLEQIGAKAD